MHAADHYWWDDAQYNYSHYHPHEKAPRCLPCHWTPQDEERSMREDGYKPFEGYPACPCTVQHICSYDQRNLFDEDCHMPTYPERAYRCVLSTCLFWLVRQIVSYGSPTSDNVNGIQTQQGNPKETRVHAAVILLQAFS